MIRDALLVLAVTGVLVAWFARPRRDPVSWSPERRMLAELGTGGFRVTSRPRHQQQGERGIEGGSSWPVSPRCREFEQTRAAGSVSRVVERAASQRALAGLPSAARDLLNERGRR